MANIEEKFKAAGDWYAISSQTFHSRTLFCCFYSRRLRDNVDKVKKQEDLLPAYGLFKQATVVCITFS